MKKIRSIPSLVERRFPVLFAEDVTSNPKLNGDKMDRETQTYRKQFSIETKAANNSYVRLKAEFQSLTKLCRTQKSHAN